ncbi:MAG: ABC transporter ATP-binding protein [Candidatus Nanopelagicales bacterium]
MTAAGSSAGSRSLLSAEQLTRTFGSFTAVSDVNFTVEPGEVVGLLGANGAGKTTVIRMLIGLLVPSTGRALLLGQEPSLEVRRHLGYVPQSMGLYTDLTVTENVRFSAGAFGVEPATLRPPLIALADRLVGDLSLGLQRQLAFVIALQHRPDVLVLDEPTSGVGPLSRAHLWDTIRDQADDGTGVLITTHYMAEATECDRLLLMFQGKLIAQGSERDVVGDTTAIEVETDSWAAAFEALAAADQPVTLFGRGVRIADSDPDAVREILGAAGVEARLAEVPATLEERMASLASRGTL